MTQTFVSTQQRFRRCGGSCPICGGHSGLKQGRGERCVGFLSENGEYAFCSREEYAGELELNEKTTPPTFCHKLYGACNCGKQHNPDRSNGHKPNTSNSKKEEQHRIIAQYNYQDAKGRLVYQSLRYDPKDFKQRRPDGKGGWDWKMGGVTRIPYRLPELLKASPETIVVPGH